MRCIVCKKVATSSRSVEHIIRESLGNVDHVLPPGIVCDKCNNYIAREVEKPLLDSHYFKERRYYATLPNKKKRIPLIDGIHLQSFTHIHLAKSIDESIPSIGVAPDADEKIIHEMVERSIEIGVGEKIAAKHIKQNDFAHDVLKEISSKGHTNLIMSNSCDAALDMFLEDVGLQNAFHFKFGADNHRGEYGENTKIKILKNFLKDKNFDKIIVIDDMEEGIEMGLKFNAVTYLFSRNGRKNTKAHFVINDLREVLKET